MDLVFIQCGAGNLSNMQVVEKDCLQGGKIKLTKERDVDEQWVES